MNQRPIPSDRNAQSERVYLEADWHADVMDTCVDSRPDNAQIIARPPLVYAGALLTVAALRWIWPMAVFQAGIWDEFAVVLLVEGIAVIVWGRRALAAAGTEINPKRPTTTIVDAGPYRYTRNPLYLGLTFGYVAFSIWLNSWWAVIVLPVLLAVIYFKLNLAPANDLVNAEGFLASMRKLADYGRYVRIGESIKSAIDPLWIYSALFLLLYLTIVKIRLRKREKPTIIIIALTLFLMVIGYFVAYVITPYDIAWHVSVSVNRLILQLWPSIVFICFMIASPIGSGYVEQD